MKGGTLKSALNRCPKCGRQRLRMKVELFLDIPASRAHRLHKGALRSRDVKVDGAGWPKALYYCDSTCGYLLRLDGP